MASPLLLLASLEESKLRISDTVWFPSFSSSSRSFDAACEFEEPSVSWMSCARSASIMSIVMLFMRVVTLNSLGTQKSVAVPAKIIAGSENSGLAVTAATWAGCGLTGVLFYFQGKEVGF